MLQRIGAAAAVAVLAAAGFVLAQSGGHGHGQSHAHGGAQGAAEAGQPYAGLEARGIASLSEEDVAQLASGGGWGLALPAELNGYPGPRHVLELAEALELSADQRAAFEALFDEMERDAIAVGTRLIEAEAALSDAFRAGEIDDAALRSLVARAEALRGELRYAHLARHLASYELMSPTQIARYNVLRGYADDPCAATPDGHDPTMWRRHNNCG